MDINTTENTTTTNVANTATPNNAANKTAAANTSTKANQEVLFPLGQTVATPAAIKALAESNETPIKFLSRHERGDWGDCSPEDAKENDFSVKNGFRIFSVYHISSGTKIWVITEADRSVTTILLPSEY